MPKTKISEFSATPANNTDIDSINIAEGCAPSGINDAIRELMAQLKDWQSGTSNDPYVVGSSGSLTLNQGTANTVPYLNGSKVVTSGSALKFDGTNLGLGVTPATWSSNAKAIELGSGSNAIAGFGTGNLELYSGVVYGTTGYKYAVSGSAVTNYRMDAGSHKWFSAPSGTAGNDVNFNATTILDASGNIGLGITPSPAEINFGLQTGASSVTSYAYSKRGIAVNSYFDSSAYKYVYNGYAVLLQSVSGAFVWNTAASGTAGDTITFNEVMRLDNTGNLLVGTSSRLISDARRGLSVLAPSGTYVAASFANDAGNSAQTAEFWNKSTSGNNAFISFATEASFTERGSISYSRGAGLTVYGTTSDYRAKDIIGPVTGSGALIDSTPVYMGKMKGATQARPMFIAHETPDYAHTGEKDAVDENGNPKYQQMDASSLVPILWAEVQSLRQRLAAANL